MRDRRWRRETLSDPKAISDCRRNSAIHAIMFIVTLSGALSAGHEWNDFMAANGDGDEDCGQDRCHADGPNRGFQSVGATGP
jgi:hypothetical protein